MNSGFWKPEKIYACTSLNFGRSGRSGRRNGNPYKQYSACATSLGKRVAILQARVLQRNPMALPLPKQSELFEPADYLQNGSGRAFFALLSAVPGSDRKRQQSFPVDSMHAVLAALGTAGPRLDTWISQAEFYAPTRRLVHLSKLGLLFTDLDTYKVGIEASPEKLTEQLLRLCESQKLPEPSIIVFSGRGLQAKWLLQTALPQAALPRWNALQDVLNARLAAFGADAKAMDASRVLRLVQTVNSKSGQIVRVMHHSGQRYDFDQLAKELLPYARPAPAPAVEPRPAASVAILRPGPGESREANTTGLRRFMGFQLAWDRLADLRKLAEMRSLAGGAVPDGQRDTFVFLAAVFLAQATVNAPRFYDELRVLGREFVPHWSDAQVRDSASSALARMHDYVAGKRVEFNGKEVDPRYRFKNETLVDARWLALSPEEEREMGTIMSEGESKRRHAARTRQSRADAGAVTREEYLAAALSNTKPWEAEGISRATWYRKNRA